MTATPPSPYRDRWERFKQDCWNAIMEWGSLIVFGTLALLLDSLREYLDANHVAEAWVRVAWFGEWATAITQVGPRVIRAAREILETLAIAGHDVAYAIRHGRRRLKEKEEDPAALQTGSES